MLLLSSKAIMKRPKHSSANDNETEQDFISNIPDELLTRILSLLPHADACRTSVFSSRWKDLWMFLPSLHFVMPLYWSNNKENELYSYVEEVETPVCWSMEEVYKFYDLVDKTLALRDGMPIRRFLLYCSRGCDYDRVHDWLRIAVQCKVQTIVLRFPPEHYRFGKFWDLFKTCHTLVELSLEGEFRLDTSNVEVFFPCLKKISLLYIGYLFDDIDKSVKNIVSGCPVLEEFCIERNFPDDLKTLKVSSKSLKIIRLYFAIPAQDCKVSIDAPRLEYLYIDDELCSDFSFTKKPLSLVEAHIQTGSIPGWGFGRVVDEVDEFEDIDEVGDLNVPIFPNLIKLVIGIIGNWSDLLQYLDNVPKLEHVTILNLPPFDMNQGPPLEAPACLRFRLKEIILRNQETIRQRDLAFIEFLLGHSNNLERFTLNVRENDHKTREKLLSSYRGSNRCQFKFVPGLTC